MQKNVRTKLLNDYSNWDLKGKVHVSNTDTTIMV